MLIKIVIDVLMFVCMILEFSRWYMQPIYHEIIWIILLVLVILHLWFNRLYLKNLLKWKYNLVRWIMTWVNLWFFISFFLTIIFWLLSSQDLLPWLNIHSMKLISLHKIFGYVSIILMWIHLWINIWWLVRKINKATFYIVWTLISGYWIYAWIKLDIRKHIIWEYWFSSADWNIALYLVNHLSVVLTITFVTYIMYNLIINIKK